MSMKSLKNWKMQQLLREFAGSKDFDLKGINPDRLAGATGFMGNRSVSISGGERSQLKQEIEAIHKRNGENPIQTISDVFALTLSIVGGMGSTVSPAEVKEFIRQFMMSQAEPRGEE